MRRQTLCPAFRRPAFTLVEAVVSMSLTALAGSALLLGVSSSLKTTGDVQDQFVASGLAEQLMDEILGCRYCAVGADPQDTYLGPSSYELGSTGRERYNDIDDYNGYSTNPAEDMWGVSPGIDNGQGGTRHANFRVYSSHFSRWRQQVSIYYVSNSNTSVKLATGQTSNFRAIEVKILFNDPAAGLRTLATSRRVVAYVPTP